jgi:RNA polymerase sigma-70 factor (ECF subfamily)
MRSRHPRATRDAIECVYRERVGVYARVAASVVGVELAADVVHDSFVRALRHCDSFRGGSLEAWLWRIVVNEARTVSARVRRDAGLLRNEGAASPWQVPDASAAVTHAILALPERQRLIVFLRYYADLDYAGIAEALDIRPGTVAATLHTAHEAIRQTLIEEERCSI